MEKEFVPYPLALRLKALGFDEPCFGFYDDVDKGFNQIHSMASVNGEQYSKLKITKAPTWQSAFRWFREKHDLACYIYRTNFTSYEWVIDIDESYAQDSELDYTSYEKAELACLDKLLEIVELESELK